MHIDNKHIKIAGAGISGMSAAIYLKKHGRDVSLYEKRGVIGGRFKGDWQGIENWTSNQDVLEEVRSMGLGLDLNYDPLPPLFLLVPGKKIYPIESAKPLCYLVKRGSAEDTLDQELFRQTQDLAIPIHLNFRLSSEAADIVATGPDSKKIFAIDLGIKFKTTHPNVAVALVDNNAAYKGYAYLLIVNGYGCLCTVLFKKFKDIRNQLNIAKKSILRHFEVDMTEITEVGGVGAFAIHDHYQKNKIRIGEAGGIQDFLFGFGIRTAMQSGLIAAKSIIEGFDYHTQAKTYFLDQQRAGLVNRLLFERIGGIYGGYGFMTSLVRKSKNPNYFLGAAYRYTPVHKLFYRLAAHSIKNRYKGIVS